MQMRKLSLDQHCVFLYFDTNVSLCEIQSMSAFEKASMISGEKF